MATLDDFTSYENVLAVLGVDNSELPHSLYMARELWEELSSDFSTWLPAGWDLDTIIANAEDPEDDEDSAEKLIKLRAYARYFCAWLFLQSGDLLLVEQISDGQNQAQRSKRENYDGMIDRMLGRMQVFKTALLQMETPTVSYSAPSFFSSATPSYDPVLNTAV